MERLDVMPENIKKTLAYHEIWPAAIQLIALADISVDRDFCDVWVALTKDRLVVLSGSHEFNEENKNLQLRKKGKPSGVSSWIQKGFESFSLEDMNDFQVENLVSSGRLTVKISGEDKAVCYFSNSHILKFTLFAKLANKVKEGKELTEEDFSDDQPPVYCPKCGLAYDEPERRICPKCVDKRKVFLRVLAYSMRYKKQIAIIIFFMFAAAAFNLLAPYLGGHILFDEVFMNGGKYYGRVIEVILLMIVTKLTGLLIGILYGRINSAFTAEVVFDIKTDIFKSMQGLSLSFFSSKQTGNLMTRINYDATHIQYFFHDGLPYFIVNFITIIGISSIMISMDWKLAILSIVPIPASLIIIRYLFASMRKLFTRRYKKCSKMNSLLNDTLTGMRVVKAFGKENCEVDRFGKVNNGVYSADLNVWKVVNTFFPILYYIMGFGGFIVWGFGGWQVVNGKLSFGELMTFVGYMGMLFGPLQFMSNIVDWWSSCMNSAQRMFEIMDSVPEVLERPDPVRISQINGDVSLKNVSFSYKPNKPVLTDIDLDIKAGEMIGIIGRTGAGKSTIANLITRLYDAKQGSISIDGINIKDLSIKDLRSQIAMVSQETYLFMGTIADNIRYARPNASMDDIIRAAKAANAHNFIISFPEGYDTRIGTGEKQLSGGERQRLSIARAILQDPRILILDEATASVDTETEWQIQEALKYLIKGRTTISIAHRLSTLRDADRLIVIEDGKIIEQGTHDELIKMRNKYYELIKKQSEAIKIRGVGE